MPGQIIVYDMPDGSVQICRPQIGARLVSAVNFDNQQQTFNPSEPAYRALRPFLKMIASGVFTEANVTWVESEMEFLARVDGRSRPQDAISSTVMQDTDTPRQKAMFRGAWQLVGNKVTTDMLKARDIHAENIAISQASEITRLTIEERKERLKGNAAQANQRAADITALEALNLGALATQIQNAATPEALKAIWPAKVP